MERVSLNQFYEWGVKTLFYRFDELGLPITKDTVVDDISGMNTNQLKQYLSELSEVYNGEVRDCYPEHDSALFRFTNNVLIYMDNNKPDLDALFKEVKDSGKYSWGSTFSFDANFVSPLFSEIMNKIETEEDTHVKALLSGMGFIIAYQVESVASRNISKMLVQFLGDLFKLRQTNGINIIIEDAFSINQTSFSRSDICHIRNSFAHAQFEFIDESSVRIRDYNEIRGRGQIETYCSTFEIESLVNYLKSFRVRLDLLFFHSYFLLLRAMLVWVESDI